MYNLFFLLLKFTFINAIHKYLSLASLSVTRLEMLFGQIFSTFWKNSLNQRNYKYKTTTLTKYSVYMNNNNNNNKLTNPSILKCMIII